ncbi:hypothetical protein Tco_0754981 [Tanacetum coccineum]
MPHDSPLPRGHTLGSDEGSMTLHELTVLCTQLSHKVESLETELKQSKQTYGAAFTKLIKKVKKLEQTVKTSQARRRAKIVSSQEDQPEDQLGVLSAAKKSVKTYTRRGRAVITGNGRVSTASRLFSTAEESVSTVGASMPVSTAGMVQDVSIPSPSATKDKGKAIMQESEQPKKIKKRVQIQMSLDEELAQKLYEEEQARFNAEQEAKFNVEQEELLASETTEDEANPSVTDIDWDDVQAQIQADKDLAQRMLEEERESLSIAERARLLAELIDKRKKLQAAQQYEAIRNKPQTMSRQRKTMCTYMKNMAGYKMEHFKGKSFYEVKEMFDKAYKQVTLFVLMDSAIEKERTKRAGLNLQEESSKRQKTREGSESTEEPKADEISQEGLQQIMMVVLVEEVYVEALQIFANMLKKFDRDDLVKIWDLVKERFYTTEPTDNKEKELWVELKRLFKPDNDDTLWKLQRYMHDPLV